MKYKNILSISLIPFASTFGQPQQSNADAPVLDEIGVKDTQLKSLDLSRATILSQDTLENRQVHSLEDLNGLSPNLHLSGNGIKSFGDVLTMRGIGNTQFFGSPGVQLYVDGVPQGNVFSYGSDLYDLEAVEVLKGPQGSRFGKLAPGGAINLITKKPGETQTSKVSASYATFNTQKYNISSSGPMDEKFSYSLGIQRSLSDGFLNNTAGRDNDSETWNGRLSFQWDGGTGTKATLGASFSSHELGAQPLVLRNQADFYARSVDEDEFTEIDQNQQFLKLEHETDFGTIHSITSRNDWNMNPNVLDGDLGVGNPFLPAPLDSLKFLKTTISQDISEWSQYVAISGGDENDYNWSFALFYEDSEVKGDSTRLTLEGKTFMGDSNRTTSILNSENFAGFFAYENKFSETTSASINLRIDSFDKKIERSNSSQVSGDNNYNSSIAFEIFSPTISIEHKISENFSTLAKIGYTEKPGGFSAFTNKAQSAFESEEITSYEIGFNLSEKSWNLGIKGFLNDINNYQFEQPVAGTSNYYLENAEEASVYGLEVDSLLNLGGGWTFAASYGLTESEFKKVSALPTLVGKQLSFVPDHSLSIVLGHELDNGLSYQVGSRTVGKTFFWDNTGTNSNDAIDSYTLLEAQISYENNDWNLNIFGTNLTGEEFYTSLVSSLNPLTGGIAPGVAGSPRVIGLSLSKEF